MFDLFLKVHLQSYGFKKSPGTPDTYRTLQELLELEPLR